MPLRMNRKELIELIESIETGGGDATQLRAELNQMPLPSIKSASPGGKIDMEELTTEERLSIEVGDLFPGGITSEIFDQLCDLDTQHSLKQLKDMCIEVGLSPNGHKKKLAAKLLARGYFMSEAVNLNKQKEWEGKPGDVKISEVYIKDLHFEIVVFTRKERGGSDFSFRCREYEKTQDGQWRFGGVVIDTSRKDAQGNVIVTRISYHPEVMLVNTAFMVLDAPEE